MSASVSEINFFDPATNDCPYPAYQQLRDEAPVWQDPRTGMYFVTRYEDIRMILLDTKRFSNGVGNGAGNTGKAVQADDPIAQRAERLAKLYEEKGWLPASTLDGRDEPKHMQMRRMFDHAFRPSAIKEIDPYVEHLALRAARGLPRRRHAASGCGQFAVPLPLYVIGRQIGVPDEDLPQIKGWTDEWVKRMGLMPDRRGGRGVGARGDRGPALLPADVRAAAPRAGRHAAERPRQPRDPRVGPPAERQRAPRRDDGRPVRRRLGDDHERARSAA